MLKEQLHRSNLDKELLLTAYRYMQQAKHMAELYEANKEITAKYVHATSRGHEAIQIAMGLQLLPQDFASPYYRDDSMLLAMGLTPYELMLQLLAKRDDPFSGGRTYYSHPSLRRDDFPKIPHQSSATGMQAIPATGVALGMRYIERTQCFPVPDEKPVCVCSLGDASVTEGEVSEAFQMAVLKSLPILYLVQDNEWDISAYSDEVRVMNAAEYARGFSGMEVRSIDGTDFFSCFETIRDLLNIIRKERRPVLLHASVPLLNHHTSGVRKEWYRDDLDEAMKSDPLPKFKTQLIDLGFDAQELNQIDSIASEYVKQEFIRALAADDPKPEDLYTHMFAPTPITEETGNRKPEGKEATVMVDCALFAIQELMEKHPECLLYGQDVGARLGGVFREAATLAQKFGDERTFNTPIQEAFIIGSTVGMSAVGLKPIVEVQFADYIWPGLNQLFTEVARSCYLSNGKWPVSCIIRVPIGAYGSGGPYHSSSVESVLSNIKGIKVVYPSTGADLKGLMKAAYYDPNPVVILEHKGLYWSKIKGTEEARSIEPDENYMVPIGKSRLVLEAKQEFIESGETLSVITYGMGVYWAKNAARHYPGHVEIIDLRTIMPLDETAIYESVRKHGKCLVISEEPLENSFALSIAGRIQKHCFDYLDAAVDVIGSENLPAIPLNITLEKTMIPNAEKVDVVMKQMLIS
ncbi:MAG TPA: thiamine pyrophosphate-dependent enzyme [Bacteroidia bacterium]|nr:thiamine pyrophosphate-dependent enzyme [Bacteroidia bacterium]